jgi:hypothetical protein
MTAVLRYHLLLKYTVLPPSSSMRVPHELMNMKVRLRITVFVLFVHSPEF